MSSSNWAEIPGGHGLGSIVSKLETTHHPALSLFFFFFFFPDLRQSCFHQCTRFLRDWSEDLLTIPLSVLASGPKFLDKSARRGLVGVCRRVTGLRIS